MSTISQELKIKGITSIGYFTKGHRGILYTGIYKNKKVVIKAKLPESKAISRIENEGNWLKRLNKLGIGPKLIKATNDYFFYHYIDGKFIIDFIEENEKSRKIILKIIKDILNQCFVLDKLKVDKEEMHHPLKHIIITKKYKVIMLDFERCHIVEKGKNVTQFVVFLMRLKKLLSKYKIKISQKKLITLSKIYKKKQTKKNLKKILDEIKKEIIASS